MDVLYPQMVSEYLIGALLTDSGLNMISVVVVVVLMLWMASLRQVPRVWG